MSSLGVDEDHVKLWQYFEDRARTLEASLFQTMTWLLGFASALVTYAVERAIAWSSAPVAAKPLLLGAVCVVGLVLVVFGVSIIRDVGNHINRNFARAVAARDNLATLGEIIRNVGKPNQKLPPICRRVEAVTLSFGAIFALGLLLLLGRLA